MAFLKKTAYMGVDPVDFKSKHDRKSSSRYSRLSDITLLKSKARSAGTRLASGALHGTKCMFSKKFWQSIPSHTKTFVRRGVVDLKTVNWQRNFYRVWIFLWPILFMTALIVILPVVSSHRLYQPVDACQPDSGFRVGYSNYNIWAISGFFQITLTYGRLSFTAAKIITVCWDVS